MKPIPIKNPETGETTGFANPETGEPLSEDEMSTFRLVAAARQHGAHSQEVMDAIAARTMNFYRDIIEQAEKALGKINKDHTHAALAIEGAYLGYVFLYMKGMIPQATALMHVIRFAISHLDADRGESVALRLEDWESMFGRLPVSASKEEMARAEAEIFGSTARAPLLIARSFGILDMVQKLEMAAQARKEGKPVILVPTGAGAMDKMATALKEARAARIETLEDRFGDDWDGDDIVKRIDAALAAYDQAEGSS